MYIVVKYTVSKQCFKPYRKTSNCSRMYFVNSPYWHIFSITLHFDLRIISLRQYTWSIFLTAVKLIIPLLEERKEPSRKRILEVFVLCDYLVRCKRSTRRRYSLCANKGHVVYAIIDSTIRQGTASKMVAEKGSLMVHTQ